MDDVDIVSEIPLTPVRSSGGESSYSDHSLLQNDSAANSIVSSASVRSASGHNPPLSPQRSTGNSVASSPASIQRNEPQNPPTNVSPIPSLRTTPAAAAGGGGGGPQQEENRYADLFAEFDFQQPPPASSSTSSSQQQQPPPPLPSIEQRNNLHYNPAEMRNPYLPEEDEQTDPSSSITPNENNSNNPAYTRNDATSTFGRVIQPLKERMGSMKRSGTEDDEAQIPKGAIIFGYLQKQGRNGKWQTRWFESDGECLTYYKSDKRSKVLATLDLAKVGSIRVNRDDSDGCSFTINISHRPYHLRADSKESCKDWVITLNRVKEARNQVGNVKLVNSQPPDLLDSDVCPRVVVVASRSRTHAVDDNDDLHHWEATGGYGGNPAEDDDTTPEAHLARWQKSRRKLSSFAHKVLRWARSIRKYGCTDAENHVVLDHHVHPPGHDDKPKRSTNPTPAKSTGNFGPKETDDDLAWLRDDGVVLTNSSVTSTSGSESMNRPRIDSIDARVLS